MDYLAWYLIGVFSQRISKAKNDTYELLKLMGAWFDEIREVFKKHAIPGGEFMSEMWDKLQAKRFAAQIRC